MPVYNTSNTKKPVGYSGRSTKVWDNEDIDAGGKSMQISLSRDQHQPTVLSVELKFSAAPGAFNIELQTADTDEDIYYLSKGAITAVSANHVARLEVTNIVAKFARLAMISLTNNVNITATLN